MRSSSPTKNRTRAPCIGDAESVCTSKVCLTYERDIPGGSDGKEPACNVGDLGLIPGSGRFPGEGNDNPIQYSCLGNHPDREAWLQRAPVHVVARVRHDLAAEPSPLSNFS